MARRSDNLSVTEAASWQGHRETETCFNLPLHTTNHYTRGDTIIVVIFVRLNMQVFFKRQQICKTFLVIENG